MVITLHKANQNSDHGIPHNYLRTVKSDFLSPNPKLSPEHLCVSLLTYTCKNLQMKKEKAMSNN